MKKYNTAILNSILFILCCAYGCSESSKDLSRVESLPYYEDPSFTPHWFSADDQALKEFHTIGSFSLTNQDGESITEKSFTDKIYVVDFFFTVCPGICPKMTANMGLVQEAFIDDNEILLLSHSVTPEQDSVPRLKRYAETKGVESGKWHLVTGARKDIYHLGRQEYFIEENLGVDKSEDAFLHTENFVLIDKQKHIRGIYNGINKTSVKQLIADIKTLKKEG